VGQPPLGRHLAVGEMGKALVGGAKSVALAGGTWRRILVSRCLNANTPAVVGERAGYVSGQLPRRISASSSNLGSRPSGMVPERENRSRAERILAADFSRLIVPGVGGPGSEATLSEFLRAGVEFFALG